MSGETNGNCSSLILCWSYAVGDSKVLNMKEAGNNHLNTQAIGIYFFQCLTKRPKFIDMFLEKQCVSELLMVVGVPVLLRHLHDRMERLVFQVVTLFCKTCTAHVVNKD